MNTEYKYQQDYDNLKNPCPPSDYTAQEIVPVFRWIFKPIHEPENFLPQYHKKPKRFLNKDDLQKCKALGLSFFNNLEGAVERFNELKSILGGNVYSTLGTDIAEGKIEKSDGVNGPIERLGHFTHHPSETAQYEKIFQIIQSL